MPISTFVGRESEVRRLEQFLERVKAGEGQIVFVAGEAGAGKTALVNEFVRRAQEGDAHTIAALGQCNAQTGAGDAYLPFREILATLVGSQDDNDTGKTLTPTNASRLRDFARLSGQTLVDVAPDLVGIFVPGASLIGKIASAAVRHSKLMDKLTQGQDKAPKDDANSPITPELDQEKVFQQYATALQALSKQQTLILFIDDLHWADAASLNLLFHLTRQLQASHVLLVGAYRPADVALGRGGERHPLESVLNELKRYQGEIVLNLDETRANEGRAFVDAVVDAEPNQLDAAFRQELFARTDGHPLFTVEMLRNLQERHNLVKDAAGRWIRDETLDWETLPARVDGVIAERMARLTDDARETLNIASVIGSQFAVQVVAQVQHGEERDLLKRLTRDLDKRHHLVKEEGETKVGSHFLFLYRFSHALFQQFLYDELSAGERRLLHGDVAESLERLYAGSTGLIAVQLARHYIEAGIDDKAAEYHIQAGDESKRLFAGAEARFHYLEALSLLQRLPDTVGTRRLRFDTTLKYATMALGSDGPYELLTQLLGAEALGKSLLEAGRPSDLVGLAYLRIEIARLYLTLNQPYAALAICEEVLSNAKELGDDALHAWATGMIGVTKLDQGFFAKAQSLLAPALSYLEAAKNWREWAWMKMNLAFALASQGDVQAALEHAAQSLARAQETQDAWMLCVVHLFSAHIYWAGGDIHQMLAEARAVIQIGEEKRELNFVQLGSLPQMWAESKLGDQSAAARSLQRRRELIEQAGVEIVWADWAAAARAEMALNGGQVAEAINLAEAAIGVAQAVGGTFATGLAERTWAEALAASTSFAFPDVEKHLAESLRQFEEGAAHLEAARTHLVWGKLLHGQGQEAAARRHLVEGVTLFERSGIESEIKAARTLLSEIGAN